MAKDFIEEDDDKKKKQENRVLEGDFSDTEKDDLIRNIPYEDRSQLSPQPTKPNRPAPAIPKNEDHINEPPPKLKFEDRSAEKENKPNIFQQALDNSKNSIKAKIDFAKNAVRNVPSYVKDYFTKDVPEYFQNDKGQYTFGSLIKGVGKVAKDCLIAGAKATLAIACCIPGPSAIAAGAINGARMAYSMADNRETQTTSNPKLKKFLAVAVGATVGGLIGSVAPGVMGVAGAAYDTKRLLEKSGEHFEKTQADLKSLSHFEEKEQTRGRGKSFERDALSSFQEPGSPGYSPGSTKSSSKQQR
ncbi:MAG: hypothetical protein ACK4OM_02585 [Alphaproteobacteria bacterium]